VPVAVVTAVLVVADEVFASGGLIAELEGSEVTIEARNLVVTAGAEAKEGVQPGNYVLLSVSDTGTGIPASHRERVFDPFFTTKGPGGGTGLGLSMVYGFVSQSGGHVAISSEEGRGTVVRLYLPRAYGVPETEAADTGSMAGEPARRETILLVEDDTEVREATAALLEGLGYSVLAAESGEGALACLASAPRIDLLLTDVLLGGGWTGTRMAQKAAEMRPGTPVLYVSGYAEQGPADTDAQLLRKPFRRSELNAAVRRAIGSRPQPVTQSNA